MGTGETKSSIKEGRGEKEGGNSFPVSTEFGYLSPIPNNGLNKIKLYLYHLGKVLREVVRGYCGSFWSSVLVHISSLSSLLCGERRERSRVVSLSWISSLYKLPLSSHWSPLNSKRCWGWNSNTLATSCEELTHWKRPWCWEGLGAGGEGDDRGWDGWMASLTQWTWIWVDSRSWWWTGRPGVLQFTGLQRVGRLSYWTELNSKRKWKTA